MKRIKDFIMSFRGKFFIMLITFIITILFSLYVEIKLYSDMKGGILFFDCMMYFGFLSCEIYTFLTFGDLFLQQNRFTELKDYFKWWAVGILLFVMYHFAFLF